MAISNVWRGLLRLNPEAIEGDAVFGSDLEVMQSFESNFEAFQSISKLFQSHFEKKV